MHAHVRPSNVPDTSRKQILMMATLNELLYVYDGQDKRMEALSEILCRSNTIIVIEIMIL